MDTMKLTDWIQAYAGTATAAIALGTAYYAYRTLEHMRQSSSENTLRDATARTLKECKPIYEEAVRQFQELAASLNERPVTEGCPKRISAILNSWEAVATGINSGVFDPEVFYLLGKAVVQKHYWSLSWFVRQYRLVDPNSYDELEELLNRINEIDYSSFAITSRCLKALRALRVPGPVIRVARKASSTTTSRSSQLALVVQWPLHRSASTKDTWYRLENKLDKAAAELGVPIDLYKPVIFRTARCRPPGVVHIDAHKRKEHFNSEELRLYSLSEVDMYRQIFGYTGQKYPFDLKDAAEESIKDWCEKEETKRVCQLVLFDETKPTHKGKCNILGHMTLADFTVDKRWNQLFSAVNSKARAVLTHSLDRDTCIMARDWYFDKKVRRRAVGRTVIRRLLRGAIEMIEEGHFEKGNRRNWLLLGLVPPGAEANAKDQAAQKEVVEQEGGRLVGRFKGPRDMPADIYVFGQEFKALEADVLPKQVQARKG
jgi:hypothetical protein